MEHRVYPRLHYVITTVVFVDFPLGLAVQHHAWFFIGVIGLVLLILTVHRLIDIGWQRGWAVPLCCVGMSPALILYARPSVGLWWILGCMAVLQVPVMAWPKKKTGTALPSASVLG
jgi:hypothetical protein